MRSNNRMQILRQMEKNITYESIRFNNKQISDELIKVTIEQYFPKIFANERWCDLTFFTKAMKDEEFYKKIRTLVSTQLSLEQHLQELQQRQLEKSKIQDYSSSHGVQELNNNKKMTRAALARRNQQTQQQLRKDQIYVRLTPKTQDTLKWMLCNRKFPRIECKLSCNQHIQYLVNYLSNKWLSSNKGNNRIVLYPDIGSFLKNNMSAKQREKILKQPLNNFYMFTDVMIGSGIGQNGILNLHYEILEKKKDAGLTSNNGVGTGNANNITNNVMSNSNRHNNTNNSGMIMDNSLGGIMSSGQKKHTGYVDSHGQMILTDSHYTNNNKRSTITQRQDDINMNNKNNKSLTINRQQYVPVGSGNKQSNIINNSSAINGVNNIHNNSRMEKHLLNNNLIGNNNNINNRHNNNNNNNQLLSQITSNQNNQSSLLMNNAHYSNHFLSNQSNLLNPNGSIYHDQESIFKSIGFFALGGGNNTYGFQKKNDFHLLTVNSNSYIDVGLMNQLKDKQREKEKEKEKQSKKDNFKQSQMNRIIVEEKQINSQVNIMAKQYQQKDLSYSRENDKKGQMKIQQQQKSQKQQKSRSSSSPRQIKVIKPIPSSPKKDLSFNSINSTSLKNQQKQKQPSPFYNLPQVSEIKQQSLHDVKKHEQKLLDLRNAINLFQQEGFNDNEVKNEEISQKELKQVKTVSIKKKLAN